MGIPDGAHTHGSGGSGGGTVVLVVLAGVVLAAAGPVLLAVVHALVIAAVVLVVLAAAAGATFAVWRACRAAPVPPWPRGTLHAPRPGRALPEPRPAVEHHLHFHGVTAEDIAVIIRQQQSAAWPAIEEDPWPPQSSS